jgi:FKBP-type peptidyl-prolyl cis-trans isomerase SlyD
MLVQKDSIVSLRYVIKDNSGEIIEDIMNNEPIKYLHGSGNILPSLESALEGLHAGANKTFTIHDGQLNSPLHFDIIVDEIRKATIEEINSGRPDQKECGPGCCC